MDNIIEESAEVIQRLRNYNASVVRIGGFGVADPVIKEAIQMIGRLTVPLSDEWSASYTVKDEDDVPPELRIAKAQGAQFQCTSLIGWIDLAPDDIAYFRNSNTYRFRKHNDSVD